MSLASPQQRRRIQVTPRGAPAGAEVEISVSGMPPLTGIVFGFGNLQQHSIIGRSATDEEGSATEKLILPDWSERDKVHFFFVAFADQQPRGFSDPFHVTAADGTMRVSGRITDEGTSCTALRTARDDLYTLVGDMSAWKPGDRVALRGSIGEGAPCGDQGITVVVSEIRAAL